jgi:hypothetical protein
MVPDKLITADCHIAPPYELINELPESYREYLRTKAARMFSRPGTSSRWR